ncbi:MAG TPA: TetR/AcrR family transcriptional regulator [Anaerolineales bacterium]|nr:TetR/AcrR family transcriptional regulator [Anaerolineales bacterium]
MQPKDDRRSQRTRQALGDALVELMMEKGYNAISIKEIIERANVGRSTFYTHFTDKEALFASQLDRLMDLLSQHIPQEHAEGNPYFPSLGLFLHIKQQWRLYRILSWGTGVDVLTKHLQKSMCEMIEQRLVSDGQTYEVPIPVIANFLTGSFLSLVQWWLDNKMVYSPEEIDMMFRKLAFEGMKRLVV